MIFGRKSVEVSNRVGDFAYLDSKAIYLDSACQSLRPQPVIDAQDNYYKEYNACSDRVKYAWGKKADSGVAATRIKALKLLKHSDKDYFTSFTLNTTYGLHLILSQLETDGIDKVITTDIEHNSVFLATISFARTNNIPREVLARSDDGSISLDHDFSNALVVVNTSSNIDGRRLLNVRELVDKVHASGGLVILDAAQTMGHNFKWLAGVPADAICFSAHKMYAPSLGVIVAKRSLLSKITPKFVGGGMVNDVSKDDYILTASQQERTHTIFEPGLQAWGEIIALGEAIGWLQSTHKDSQINDYSKQLIDWLRSRSNTTVINEDVTPVVAFYHEKVDSHLLAEGLSEAGIMVRSGYFCCHYYLDHIKKYPPLLRMSLGLHNTQADIDRTVRALEGVLR